MAGSTTLPHRKVVQARALLWAGDGVANAEIARRCQVTPDAVRRWRSRFAQEGTAGVGAVAKGRGRKPSLPAGHGRGGAAVDASGASGGRLDAVEHPDDGRPRRDR